MDNEHTTITGRQANPRRPGEINSFRINDHSLFCLPFTSVFYLPLSSFSPSLYVRAREWSMSEGWHIAPQKVLGKILYRECWQKHQTRFSCPLSLNLFSSFSFSIYLLILISLSFSCGLTGLRFSFWMPISRVEGTSPEWFSTQWHSFPLFLPTLTGRYPRLPSLFGTPGKSMTLLTGLLPQRPQDWRCHHI